MKKIYKTPITETVNVRLYSSILQDGQGNLGEWSKGAAGGDEEGWGDAKENNGFFDMDDSFGDTWDEEEAKGLWE